MDGTMTAKPLHNTTAEWQAIDLQHHLHPFTNYQTLPKDGVRIIRRA